MSADFRKKLDNSRLLDLFVDHLQKEHNFSKKDIHEILQLPKPLQYSIPVSIFSLRDIGSFEAIVKFLHEDKHLPFSQISKLTNRDPRTIWSSYASSKKKHPASFLLVDSDYEMPVSAISDRGLSVLETLVTYLKRNYSLSYSQIARLLQRDPRTIFTIKSRVEKKNEP